MKILNETEKAVELISKTIEELLKKKDYVVLAVPGGRSVKNIFSLLKTYTNIIWDKVHVFIVDERLVKIEDKDSNFRSISEQFTGELVAKGRISPKNIHPFKVNLNKKDFGVGDYETELKKFGGKFDIVILGVGEDGHVGALFPKYTIENESDYFFVFHDSPKPPKDRMTSSRNLLSKADLGILLFIGEGKKEAFEKFKNSEISIEDCPAKIVYDMKNYFILTDLE